MGEEDFVFVTLRCKYCEQEECVFCPNGTHIYDKEGCTRKVSDEAAARYQHYTKEVLPFWRTYNFKQIKQSYKEIINFLFDEIYSAPIGQKLNKNGKVSKY